MILAREPLSVIPFAILLSLGGSLAAQDAGPAGVLDPAAPLVKLGLDQTKIHWLVPGQFEIARRRAASENRLLIIKGISFGVDDAGAVCATKGKW